MATRTIEGTLDTLSIDAGSEITYLGATAAGNSGEALRGFRVNPGTTGDILVTIDKSSGIDNMEIFQEDDFAAGNAPTGYSKYANIVKDGKGKGVVGVAANGSKDYIVLLRTDGYSEVSYNGTVVVP